MKQSTSSGLLQ